VTRVLEGVRVIEVAILGFVPSAGMALSEWGADVIKIEHPETGDPMRGAVFNGISPRGGNSSLLYEVFNRGKRSVGIDLRSAEGHETLMKLVEHADVFLVNFTEDANRALKIDVDDVMQRNPRIVYGRGTAQGLQGPEAGRGGYDLGMYWARSGAMVGVMPAGSDVPSTTPATAFGDIQSGLFLAGGIAAGLFHRERTGKGVVVDTSLLSAGLWAMQAGLAGAHAIAADNLPKVDRKRPWNPLVNTYMTSDHRFVYVAMMETEKWWPTFCETIGHAELIDDARYCTHERRVKNAESLVEMLDEAFVDRDLDYWKTALSKQDGTWGVAQAAREALHDPQSLANEYVQWIEFGEGSSVPLARVPVRFDGWSRPLTMAPSHGEHTDEVLLEAGVTYDEIIQLKLSGAVL
jgi:crotonobetainyl-CoA:carnitine CoA-transferase CaiB-like acyl-CoA transferase